MGLIKKEILRAKGLSFVMGSKGDRYKLIITDIEINPKVQDIIDASIRKSKLDSKYKPIKIQDFIRNQKIVIMEG